MLPEKPELEHRAPYDAAKAREYYLKNRKLKGRKKGTPEQEARIVKLKGMLGKPKSPGSKPDPGGARKAAAQRVTSLRKELSDLNAKLKEKMAASKKSAAKEKKGPTAAEKSKAAKDSKQYRDKNQQKLKNDAKKAGGKESTSKSTPDSVEGLKKEITKVKAQLSAAVAKQKALG